MSRLDRPIRSAGPGDPIPSHSPAWSDEDPVLADLVEELTARLRAGGGLDRETLARDYPDHAQQLLSLLPALEALAQAGGGDLTSTTSGKGNPPGTPLLATNEEVLGDFRLLGEVGRGGMGVVYEAEQISLARRVALKVLPFASTLHPRQVQRFKNEALAAAGLNHGHIVPVYAVGCEHGVHFYAMQLINGQTLAEVVRDLGGSDKTPPPSPLPQEERGSKMGRLPLSSWGRGLGEGFSCSRGRSSRGA